MRRQVSKLVLTATLVLAGTPLMAVGGPVSSDSPEPSASQAPVAVQRVAVPANGIRDEAAMVLVGTVLIGLAAAVRRAA